MPYPSADRTPLPGRLDQFPDRPLVYVTFGTEVPDERPLALVIDALHHQPVRLLATVGHHHDPSRFGSQPENVAIERFVPQAAVLPRAAAVISHGGSGTVLAALGAGLPQLCLPYFADQPINAKAITDAGAGLTLDIAAAGQQEIAEAVTRLLSEATFHDCARMLAAEIAHMPSAVEVARTMSDWLIEELAIDD
jgi:UDP:flavonoid glycosyltransferase YjiC (YdhE family)